MPNIEALRFNHEYYTSLSNISTRDGPWQKHTRTNVLLSQARCNHAHRVSTHSEQSAQSHIQHKLYDLDHASALTMHKTVRTHDPDNKTISLT
jgi:hypothetical protein